MRMSLNFDYLKIMTDLKNSYMMMNYLRMNDYCYCKNSNTKKIMKNLSFGMTKKNLKNYEMNWNNLKSMNSMNRNYSNMRMNCFCNLTS